LVRSPKNLLNGVVSLILRSGQYIFHATSPISSLNSFAAVERRTLDAPHRKAVLPKK
jgi:hypothetical protein